jgi:uncharacterized protein (TIGR00251 family)
VVLVLETRLVAAEAPGPADQERLGGQAAAVRRAVVLPSIGTDLFGVPAVRRPVMVADDKLALWIQPRSHCDEVVGLREEAVVIRLTAPPVEGAANEALRRFVARRLGVATSRVSVVRGQRSRSKWIAVEGFNAEKLRIALLEGEGSGRDGRGW